MIEIGLSQLQAYKLSQQLKVLADRIEVDALKENRVMNPEEDLIVSIYATLFVQILEQKDKLNDKVIKEEQEDYDMMYVVAMKHQAKYN